MDISIVIPVFNEKGTIEELYGKINNAVKNFREIIFVDDGSSDGSTEIIRGIASKDKKARAVVLSRNYGQTAALSTGFLCATGEFVVTLDADLQNDPADIPELVRKAEEGWDVVSGWRKKRQDPFLAKQLPSAVANVLISSITGVRLHDYGCTLKAYRRSLLENLVLYGEMHRFLPAYLAWNGARICELSVSHHARRYGESHYGLERVFKVVLDLLVAKFLLSYITKPIYVFGGMSLVFFLLSLLTGAAVVARKVFYEGQWISPLIFVCFFLAGVSVLCLLMGFLAEIMTRIYFEARKTPPCVIKEKINCERN
ncbi:MAG: glycosyltransferase family 2 protein [Endomicrobiales bacterium]|nr:glycosyltransferase family 2 protein [Endomicrobiales bacterium]